MSQIFKILLQIGDINIFVLHGVFLMKKHQRRNLRHTLVEKLSENNVAKY